jgi:hypothetical protein
MSVERSQSYNPEQVTYHLWSVPRFPLEMLDQRRAWRDPVDIPWIWGLLDDIREAGCLRNPILAWNHHGHDLLPPYCARHGGNRIWCAIKLGWTHVPVVTSTDPREKDTTRLMAELGGTRVSPYDLQPLFPDGGTVWVNGYGFGLYDVKRPEETYAHYRTQPTPEATDPG